MPSLQNKRDSGSRPSPQQGSNHHVHIYPDNPMPSIERESEESNDDSSFESDAVINTPTSSASPVAPAPQCIVQPQQRSNRHEGTSQCRSTACGADHDAGGIDILDLTGINTALDDLERGSHEPPQRTVSTSLQPHGAFNPAAPQGHVRRSSRTPRRSLEPPHNVDDETVPNDRFNNPIFQQALTDSVALATELRDVLGSGDLHRQTTSVMKRLHQEAVALANFKASGTRKVGFVGDSGVGKSSLLNSLLDVQGLARTSNEGSACTCVATEYHYHNLSNIAIQVDHFTEDEINEQLEDLLRAYRHYHQHRNDPDAQDHEDKAKLAFHTFKAMFGTRLGVITRSAHNVPSASSLLGRNGMDVLRTLRAWAQEAMAFSISSSSSRLSSDTIAQASDELARLTSELPHGEADSLPWPFTKKIRVFLNASILSRGLVLIDLPGLRDMNTARRNITERYMTHGVDEIFAVCLLGRAVTDEGVKVVFDLAARAGLRNVGIICTKADDFREEETGRSMPRAERQRTQRRREIRDQVRIEYDHIEMELGELEIDGQVAPEDEPEHSDLSRQQRAVRARLSAAQFEVKQCIVRYRNRTVTAGLISQYEAYVPSNTLRIFCISNTEYWGNRKAARLIAMPHLELSGIVELRQHCRSMVSESQHRLASDYMQNRIPVLLSEVGLWVTSAEAGSMDAERRRVFREALGRLQSRLRREIEHDSSLRLFGADLRHKLRDTLVRPAELRCPAWSQAAISASRSWHGWHHSSYAAFCRNYGDYSTDKAGTHCWNEEAMLQMTQDIGPMWQLAMTAVCQPFSAVRVVVREALDGAIAIIDGELEEHSDMVLPLRSALLSMQRLLEEDIHNVQDSFQRSLRLLRIETLSSIRTSLVGQFMESYYQEAIYESGTGSDRRRKSHIHNGFSDAELFVTVLDGVSERFVDLADSLHEEVNGVVDGHLERVRDALDILQTDNAAREGDEIPAFRLEVGECVDRVRAAMERVGRLIEDEEAGDHTQEDD